MIPADPSRGTGGRGPRSALRRARFHWPVNERYHGWLLRRVPRDGATALDVGCGFGALAAKLAARGLEVDALDIDAELVEQARARHAAPRIRWRVGDAFAGSPPVRRDGYDLVVAVASLHHLPAERTFERLRCFVAPGGTLLVVGLYRAESWRDGALSALALPLHVARGWLSDRCGASPPRREPRMPLAAPIESLREIRRAARGRLPSARLRRRLFWRFTLAWRAPARTTADAVEPELRR